MSKLAKAIDAKITGNIAARRDLNLLYTDVHVDVAERVAAYATEYREKQCKIGVSFEKLILIDDKSDIMNALKHIKQAIVEEVFGEFRPIIYEMMTSLYSSNDARLKELIKEMEHQMFHDGI